jgi:hypothetical protein
LLKKYDKAVASSRELQEAFEGLDENITEQQRREWEHDEKMATEHRGDYLEIYRVQMEKGKCTKSLESWKEDDVLSQHHHSQRYVCNLPWKRTRLARHVER